MERTVQVSQEPQLIRDHLLFKFTKVCPILAYDGLDGGNGAKGPIKTSNVQEIGSIGK